MNRENASQQQQHLLRIARAALRRNKMAAGSTSGVTALVGELASRLPNASAVDQTRLIAFVARQLRESLQPRRTSDESDTAIWEDRRTMLTA